MLPYRTVLQESLRDACVAVGGDIAVLLEKPRDAAHGDYACPAAMQLARVLKRPPRDLADDILRHFTPPDFVAATSIAGGGFINIRLSNTAKTAIIADILRQGEDYGRGTPKDETILLEFVSANPTGPLHVGHGRAAAFGDSLANILSFGGWSVWREYYLNDTGRQAAILAASVWLRHWLAQTEADFAMPPGSYRGDYLRLVAERIAPRLAGHSAPDLAALFAKLSPDNSGGDDANADILIAAMSQFFAESEIKSFIKTAEAMVLDKNITQDYAADQLDSLSDSAKTVGEKILGENNTGGPGLATIVAANEANSFIDAVVEAVLEQNIQRDLELLGVSFDRWFSEKSLHREGKIIAAIDSLRDKSPTSLYDKDGALWFRATAFGDDKDRVLRRANGQFTYFAADVAYHYDKFTARQSREVPTKNRLRLINVLGADHHGYVQRLSAALRALGYEHMEARLIQFVSLIENGKRLKMSTRAGDFVSLADLIDKVEDKMGGDKEERVKAACDAARYFYISRKNDQPLDFDLQLATEKSRKNPVFYAQYAHARTCRLLRKWDGDITHLAAADGARLADDEAAVAVCGALLDFPEVVARAAADCVVNPLAVYVQALATAMHNFYEQTRILSGDDEDLRRARLALLAAARQTLAVALRLLGVRAPEEM